MIRKRRLLIELLLCSLVLFVYCEFVLYYIVINECSWPDLQVENEDFTIENNNEDPLKILVITDIHLLGPRRGWWFEKIIREWQMYRAFHTAVNLLKPEVVFILGDTFDEGLYANPEDFKEHVDRFYNLFVVDENTELFTVVGNHDIGFHYEINPWKTEEFVNAFHSPAVQLLTIKGNHFVLLNSMAMEGDKCFLCKPAAEKLSKIEKILKCSKGNFGGICDDLEPNSTLEYYSKPILMQHFPLYRLSDIECNDFDSAPVSVDEEIFKEAWDCLSKNATFQLLNQIEPRLSISGHTHHGCTKKLPIGFGTEITIPSINWRNKDNPTIGLGVFKPNNYAFTRCPIPQQSTWIFLYATGVSVIALWIIFRLVQTRRKQSFQIYSFT